MAESDSLLTDHFVRRLESQAPGKSLERARLRAAHSMRQAVARSRPM